MGYMHGERTKELLRETLRAILQAKPLEKVTVKAEVVDSAKGPKISIIKYKNKTGYKKRQGFRAELTTVKITAINA